MLDTWFSSWLWPLSTLNWPKENEELDYFYPTNTLVTAPDIIFFWVARMIMAGLEFRGKIPFEHVYFTSIIRDELGRKMSKSLGNSPDPLDVIATYGADALRFTVLYLAPLGQDVLYSNEKCEMGRNFANKIWNAGRFLMMNRESIEEDILAQNDPSSVNVPIVSAQPPEELSDRWILSRFNATVRDVTIALENFRVNEAAKMLYEFMWHDFCDWYVEFVKNRLTGTNDSHLKRSVMNRAMRIYEETLHLLHPLMPFVTEEIWQHTSVRSQGESIMMSRWPSADESLINPVAEQEMEFLQQVITAIRSVRSDMNIPLGTSVDIVANCHDVKKQFVLDVNLPSLQKMAKVGNAEIGVELRKPGYSASAVVQGQEIFIPLKGLIDFDVERSRLEKEIVRIEGQLRGVDAKLGNASFTDKAPSDIIQREKDKKENFEHTLNKLKSSLAQLAS